MGESGLKISIIVTCYNYDKYVRIAIDSALAQTYSNVEIIVVDDGSTDGSETVIATYGGRIKSIRQSNQGHIAACNTGYMEATGDLVVFLDADDALFRNMATEVAAAWTRNSAKVQYELDIIDGSGAYLGRKFCNFVDGYDASRVNADFQSGGTYRWPVTVGNAYSKWFLDLMMPLTVALAPDGVLNTVAPVYGNVVTIVNSLASYRIHGNNLWASNGTDLARLPDRIHHRQLEISILREHAARRGVSLPAANPMDFEIAFINYRLMSLKLGARYVGMEADSPIRLWMRGLALMRSELTPWRMKVIHVVWLGVLVLSPRWLASRLIALRFNRAVYLQPVRRTVTGMLRRVSGVAR